MDRKDLVIDERALARLRPVRELVPEARRLMLDGSMHYHLARGERIDAGRTAHLLLYLFAGRLTYTAPGKKGTVMEAQEVGPMDPVFPPGSPGDAELRAQTACTLVGFDRARYERLREEARRLAQTEPWEVDETLGSFSIPSPPVSQETAQVDDRQLGGVARQLAVELRAEYERGSIDIPRAGDVADRLLRAARNPTVAEETLTQLVELDPVLALTIAQRGEGRRGVRGAIAALGRDATRQIIVDYGLTGVCRARSPLIREKMRKALRYSVEVGIFSRVLARTVRGLDPEKAYLCGLVHDLGVFPVLCRGDAHLTALGGEEVLDALTWWLAREIGGSLMDALGVDQDIAGVAAGSGSLARDSGPLVDYADVVLVARLHASLSMGQASGLPDPQSVPALRKIAGSDMGAGFSLWLMGRAGRRLRLLDKLFGGATGQAPRPSIELDATS